MYNYVDLRGFIDSSGNVDWNRLKGTDVAFEYREKNGVLRVINYNMYRHIVEVFYRDCYYHLVERDFLCGNLSEITPLTFRYAVGDIVETVLQTFTVEGICKNSTVTYYDCRCGSCGCVSSLTEKLLHNKQACNYCRGFKLLAGEQDLAITHPEEAALLLNAGLTRVLDKKSDTYTDWQCPECGLEIFHKRVRSVVTNGLSCMYCSPSYSFGAKFVYAVLWQLNLNVCYEYRPSWAMGKRYDLHVADESLIVEVHGLQHYQDVYAENGQVAIAISDTFKREIATEKGITTYVELDCRYSEHEWIEKQIRQSVLATKYDLSQVDFKLCLLFAIGKVGERICHLWENGLPLAEIEKQVQTNRSQLRSTLMRGTYLNLCTYSAEEGIQRGRDAMKKSIVLLNTGELFVGLAETARKFKFNATALAHACETGGYLGYDRHTGELWQWGYEADHLGGEYTIVQKYHMASKGVVCTGTHEVFTTVKDASEAYSIQNYLHIIDACEGRRSFAGKHPQTKQGLSWVYLEDYEGALREAEQSYTGLFED